MGMLKYTLNVALTAYNRGYRVGKDYPKQQQPFLLYSAITLFIVTGLTIFNPVGALFVFILPMISSLLFTAWTTYDHHAAHHYKQGVHWSELPELHEQIKHKISLAESFTQKLS